MAHPTRFERVNFAFGIVWTRRVIVEIRLEINFESIDLPPAGGQPDRDDDLLEIRFGLADPAISKLKAGYS